MTDNNNTIESRYTIEYVTPDPEDSIKKPRKVWIALLAIPLVLGLIANIYYPFKKVTETVIPTVDSSSKDESTLISTIEENESKSEAQEKIVASNIENTVKPDEIIKNFTIAADEESAARLKEAEKLLAYPTNSLEFMPVSLDVNNNNQIQETQKEQEKLVESAVLDKENALKEVKELMVKTDAQEKAAIKQLSVNQELTKKLDNLTSQLMVEKEKNKDLNSKINIHENKNNALTNLLEKAISTVNTADQRYISALKELDKKDTVKDVVKTTSIATSTDKSKVDKIEKIAKQKPTQTKSVDYNNSISLSTAEQIDAIVAAMQNINKNPVQTKIVRKPAAPVNNKKSEQLYLSLQKQVNQLITLNETPKTDNKKDYKAALQRESNVRNNEMRSIVVKKGETLWAIAQRAYGDGLLYKKIIEANPHVLKKGKVLLIVGQIIRVPI